VSEHDRATSETPRQRGGLLGLLGRLFGRGKTIAPAEPPAAARLDDAPAHLSQGLPDRPAAWEGPRARTDQPAAAGSTEAGDTAATLSATDHAASAAPSDHASDQTAAHAADAGTRRLTGDLPAWAQPPGAVSPAAPEAASAAGQPTEQGSPAAEATNPAAAVGDAGSAADRLQAVTAASPEQPAHSANADEPAAITTGTGTQTTASDRALDTDEVRAPVASAPNAAATADGSSTVAGPTSAGSANAATHSSSQSAGRQGSAPSLGVAARQPANPIERARAALEEARRQMPGLMADAAAQPAAVAEPPREKPFAAEWPGMLEGLRQAREGLAGEVDQLRAVVGDLRREVGRLSDVVTQMQRPGESVRPAGAAGSAIPRLEAIMEQLRAISGRSASLGARPFAAGSGAPIVPPAILQSTPPFGSRPLPSIFFPGATPNEHPFAATQATAATAASTTPAADSAPAASSAQTGAHGAVIVLAVAPVDGLRALSALERRIAAASAVQRLELAGYRRGEATFRVALVSGATIQDAIKSVPDATTVVSDVRVEANAAHVRLSPRETPEAALSPS
jgi:hypothetical protein